MNKINQINKFSFLGCFSQPLLPAPPPQKGPVVGLSTVLAKKKKKELWKIDTKLHHFFQYNGDYKQIP